MQNLAVFVDKCVSLLEDASQISREIYCHDLEDQFLLLNSALEGLIGDCQAKLQQAFDELADSKACIGSRDFSEADKQGCASDSCGGDDDSLPWSNDIPLAKLRVRFKPKRKRVRADNTRASRYERAKMRFSCDQCTDRFDRRSRLEEHRSRKHGSADAADSAAVPPVVPRVRVDAYRMCAVCGRVSRDKNKLMLHIQKRHLPPTESQFLCDKCPARLKSEVGLRYHMFTHSEEKTFVCEVCGFKTATPNCLAVHKQRHADITYACPYEGCGKTFQVNKQLGTHVRRVHQKIRNYACEYCDKSFMDRKDLRSHAVRHTGEKSFYCFVCGRAFGRRKTMLRHVRTVHKVASNADAERLLLLDSIEPESQPPLTSVKTDITQILNQALSSSEPPTIVSSSKPAHLVLPLASSSSTAGSSAQNLSVVSSHSKASKEVGNSWQGHHSENRLIAAAVPNLPSVDEFYGQAGSVPYDYQYAPALAHFWQNAMN